MRLSASGQPRHFLCRASGTIASALAASDPDLTFVKLGVQRQLTRASSELEVDFLAEGTDADRACYGAGNTTAPTPANGRSAV